MSCGEHSTFINYETSTFVLAGLFDGDMPRKFSHINVFPANYFWVPEGEKMASATLGIYKKYE